MKKYVEAIEDTTGKSQDYQADFIKEEITEEKSKDKQKCKDKLKSKEKSGKTYKYRIHTCYHDEEQNTPCIVESID